MTLTRRRVSPKALSICIGTTQSRRREPSRWQSGIMPPRSLSRRTLQYRGLAYPDHEEAVSVAM
jgi:hypothetical protein